MARVCADIHKYRTLSGLCGVVNITLSTPNMDSELPLESIIRHEMSDIVYVEFISQTCGVPLLFFSSCPLVGISALNLCDPFYSCCFFFVCF